MASPPFHLALPVHDLEAARGFYSGVLGCPVGRTSTRWIDFDFFGHQVSVHLHLDASMGVGTNAVDGDAVPVRHFGAVLPWATWEALAASLRAKEVEFLIPPRIRFEGKVGEQGTFFLADPSGNALEFKSFRDPSRLFARE